MYCNNTKVFPNYTRIVTDYRRSRAYALSDRSRRRERNMKEYPKSIKYTRGNIRNKGIKAEKIDLDEFSFGVAYMISEALERENLNVEITFTAEVLPTIQGSWELLKAIFSEISEICVKEAKWNTTVYLSIRKEKGCCIFEFAYRSREKINVCDKQIEKLKSYIMRFQGDFSIKKIRNTYTLIRLTL